MVDDLKSKSQKKRDADALQDLGNQLVKLSLDDLELLPLTDVLQQAICTAKSLRSHGAIRRQSQLIGKLMRSADHDAIALAFGQMQADDSAQTAQFHAAELWRKKLIEQGSSALAEFVNEFHPDDIQFLRQLIRKASATVVDIKQKTASKALFRYIRSYV